MIFKSLRRTLHSQATEDALRLILLAVGIIAILAALFAPPELQAPLAAWLVAP